MVSPGWERTHARTRLLAGAAEAAATLFATDFAAWAERNAVGPQPLFADVGAVVAALAWRRRQLLEAQLDDRLEREERGDAWAAALAAAEGRWPGVAALAHVHAAHPLVAAEAATLAAHETLAAGMPHRCGRPGRRAGAAAEAR